MAGGFEILIGDARAGWLPFTVVLGGVREELEASRVLNDPLCELAQVALAISRTGPTDLSVRIWEEPATTLLRFVAKAGEEPVRVELIQVDPHALLASAELPRDDVLTALTQALRAYEARIPRTGEIAGWGRFPVALVHQLPAVRSLSDGSSIALPWKKAHGLARVVRELKIEVGVNHLLRGVDASLRAHRVDCDDYLFELRSGTEPFAVVHLTWSGRRERNPWPSTELYSSWEDWVQRRMLPDAEGWATDPTAEDAT